MAFHRLFGAGRMEWIALPPAQPRVGRGGSRRYTLAPEHRSARAAQHMARATAGPSPATRARTASTTDPHPGSGNASLIQRFHCHRRLWTGSANGRARRFYPAPTITAATRATVDCGETVSIVRSSAQVPSTRRHARPPVRRRHNATTRQARRRVSGGFQNAASCRTRLTDPFPGSATPPQRVGTCDHRTLEPGVRATTRRYPPRLPWKH